MTESPNRDGGTCAACGHVKDMHFDVRGCCVVFGNPDPAMARTCGCGADKGKVRAAIAELHRAPATPHDSRVDRHPHVTDTTKPGWDKAPIRDLPCATCGRLPKDQIHVMRAGWEPEILVPGTVPFADLLLAEITAQEQFMQNIPWPNRNEQKLRDIQLDRHVVEEMVKTHRFYLSHPLVQQIAGRYGVEIDGVQA